MEPPTGEITRLLAEATRGNREAESQLMTLVYGHLRKLAARQLRRERPDHTLQTTDLVHEAYQRFVPQQEVAWQGRAHFYRVASRLMREILVDYARARQTAKRGAEVEILPVDEVGDAPPRTPSGAGEWDHLIDLDNALKSLGRIEPRQEKVVEMRFFGGLTGDETAEALGVTPRTVRRDWRVARASLYAELSGRSQKVSAMGD